MLGFAHKRYTFDFKYQYLNFPGKAGGGSQGRETKTKSAKKKGNKKQRTPDSDDEDITIKKPTALEFMDVKELSDKLTTVTSLQDATEELCEELGTVSNEKSIVTIFGHKHFYRK